MFDDTPAVSDSHAVETVTRHSDGFEVNSYLRWLQKHKAPISWAKIDGNVHAFQRHFRASGAILTAWETNRDQNIVTVRTVPAWWGEFKRIEVDV